MGASVALRLAQRTDSLDEPVVLLERSTLAAGSSGRSGAILRMHYADPHVAAMARDSLREYAGFEARCVRPIGFRRTGVLLFAGPDRPDWIERLRTNVEMLGSMGIATRIVDAAEIRDLVPGIQVEDGTVGAWEPESGVLDPVKTVEGYAALARTYGAITRLGVEVTGLGVEDGRLRRVLTSEGEIEAEGVVVCAGPWTRDLLAKSGVDLPLKVVRPECAFLALPAAYREVETNEAASEAVGDASVDLEDPLEKLTEELSGHAYAETNRTHPVLVDLESGFYARCHATSGRTRVGRTDYGADRELEDPDSLDEAVAPETASWARESLVGRMPVYRDEPDAGAQAALYTLTPDAQALLGPVPQIEGVWVAAGFSGHGFKLAPAVAEGISQMILGDRVTAFPPELFAVDRFGDDVEWGGAFGL